MTTYSPAMERAIRTAFRLHEGHHRKTDRSLPYATHIVHVALLLQAHGFDESIVIAGLLHDTLEDTEYTPEELHADFGEEVAAIVLQVTENKNLKWEERKRAYLETVRTATPGVKAVCCADKLHNLSTMMEAHEQVGPDLWQTFSRGKTTTIAFYVDALKAVNQDWRHPIVEEYRSVVRKAKELLREAHG